MITGKVDETPDGKDRSPARAAEQGCLGARGHSLAGVDGKRIRRQAGHMLVAGPGETRAFIDGFTTTCISPVRRRSRPETRSVNLLLPDRILG
jgi:hypothetical protein